MALQPQNASICGWSVSFFFQGCEPPIDAPFADGKCGTLRSQMFTAIMRSHGPMPIDGMENYCSEEKVRYITLVKIDGQILPIWLFQLLDTEKSKEDTLEGQCGVVKLQLVH